MIDQSAIQELQQCPTTAEANKILAGLGLQVPSIALPKDFNITNLEGRLPAPVRKRGTMSTNSIASFVNYVSSESTDHSACFVLADKMVATAILNHGNAEKPQHGDYRAKVALEKLPDYEAMLRIDGAKLSQQTLAEWLEEYRHCITFLDSQGNTITAVKAISAVRNVKTKRESTAENKVDNLSTSRGIFESAEINGDGFPSFIKFTCQPYNPLSEREFVFRLWATTDNIPTFGLKSMNLAKTQLFIAEEFAELIVNELSDDAVPVYIGSFGTNNHDSDY